MIQLHSFKYLKRRFGNIDKITILVLLLAVKLKSIIKNQIKKREMEKINVELLSKVADFLRNNPDSLMGSKWRNNEAEVIVSQTIRSCNYNYKETGDAFSWAHENAVSSSVLTGVDNESALFNLINDKSIVIEGYQGNLSAWKTTLRVDGVPQILRVTNSLLEYVDEFVFRQKS